MKRFFAFLIIGFAIASSADAHASCNFANDKLRLITGLDPKDFDRSRTPDSKYNSPKPTAIPSTDAQYATALANAFGRASSSMQEVFCKLDFVYLTTDAGWTPVGVWEGPGRGGGKRFIVIPSSTIDTISTSLSAEENDLTGRLYSISFSSFSDTSASDSTTALLAIMAHELGHVVFAASNVDGKHKGSNPRNLPPPDPCVENTFFSKWNIKKFNQRRWVKFADTNRNAYEDSNITSGSFSTNMMTYLYQKTSLVSLFASFSPEEDVIETFKYYVLNTASSPPDLQIPNVQTNLVSRVKPSTSPLGQKVSC
jgi:hypothetical protein